MTSSTIASGMVRFHNPPKHPQSSKIIPLKCTYSKNARNITSTAGTSSVMANDRNRLNINSTDRRISPFETRNIAKTASENGTPNVITSAFAAPSTRGSINFPIPDAKKIRKNAITNTHLRTFIYFITTSFILSMNMSNNPSPMDFGIVFFPFLPIVYSHIVYTKF